MHLLSYKISIKIFRINNLRLIKLNRLNMIYLRSWPISLPIFLKTTCPINTMKQFRTTWRLCKSLVMWKSLSYKSSKEKRNYLKKKLREFSILRKKRPWLSKTWKLEKTLVYNQYKNLDLLEKQFLLSFLLMNMMFLQS